MNPETHFRGWAKPGIVPPGLGTPVSDLARTVGVQASACSGDTLKSELQPAGSEIGAPLTIEPDETLDAISGHFRLFQLRDGHRFSTDDILTAWYGTTWCPTARTALDLGSGIGTVGMICAWRLPGAKFVTVEAQSESVVLGKKIRSLQRARPTATKSAKAIFVILKYCVPPRNSISSPAVRRIFRRMPGVKSEHPQKLACRFELRGTIADYCATAAKHLAPGGFFACVFPHESAQLARVEAGARDAGLVIVRKRPVVFREGDPALVALFGMMRADDLPEWFRGQTWTEPDLIIRTREGKIHPEYSAVKLAIGFPP